jgi:uncharacterized protein (DUF2384 family)
MAPNAAIVPPFEARPAGLAMPHAAVFHREALPYIVSMERRLAMPSNRPSPTARPGSGAVVAKAAVRAASQLGMTNKVLANVVGLSEATISRMRSKEYELQPDQKSYELAVLFVRLYRSLDAIVGGDDAVAGAWLRNRNTALHDEPLKLIQTVPGLMNVIQYLDSRRAIV